LLIDCQYDMAGIRDAPDNATKYPLACGAARIPIFFTRYVVDPVSDDVGRSLPT
jgi:hypothetical protein